MIAQSAPMLCYARALTRGDSQADDLVNDALVRAYEHRATFGTRATVRTWPSLNPAQHLCRQLAPARS